MFSVGSDPEWVCMLNGNPTPVVGLLGGDKGNPISFGPEGAFQEDNVNAEGNPAPAFTVEEAVNNLMRVKDEVARRLAVHGVTIHALPSAHFTPEALLAGGSKTMEAGCTPDFDAWARGRKNMPPSMETTLRTAGGHLLMEIPNTISHIEFIQTCDYVLGLPSVLLDRDVERRSLYGKAGCFRIRQLTKESNLVEYRTLSTFWTATRESMYWAYDRFFKVPTIMNHLEDMKKVLAPEKLVQIINESDIDSAVLYLDKVDQVWA